MDLWFDCGSPLPPSDAAPEIVRRLVPDLSPDQQKALAEVINKWAQDWTDQVTSNVMCEYGEYA